ncbi:MAG: hypothetical protein AB7O57_01365 [Hyphomicrobiaceae bacterium]
MLRNDLLLRLHLGQTVARFLRHCKQMGQPCGQAAPLVAQHFSRHACVREE